MQSTEDWNWDLHVINLIDHILSGIVKRINLAFLFTLFKLLDFNINNG